MPLPSSLTTASSSLSAVSFRAASAILERAGTLKSSKTRVVNVRSGRKKDTPAGSGRFYPSCSSVGYDGRER